MKFLANNIGTQKKNKTILQRIAAGDRKGTQECFDQYKGLVWSIAQNFIGINNDTEDAVQEIFIEVWQAAERFNPEKGKEAAFITLIARRRLIDRLRKKSRRPELLFSDEVSVRCPSNLEKQIQIRLEAERARRVLKHFHPNQRKVIDMAVYGGFTHTEIADVMEMPLGTVKTLIRRGFQKLRSNLEKNAFPKVATV